MFFILQIEINIMVHLLYVSLALMFSLTIMQMKGVWKGKKKLYTCLSIEFPSFVSR